MQTTIPSMRMPPRPGTTTTSRSEPSTRTISLDIPTSQVGIPVPYVCGRRRISAPNVLWVGNLRAIYETVTEVVTEDGDYFPDHEEKIERTIITQYVIGYILDMQLGLCLGPDVVLRAIYYDDEPIWEGSAGPARAVITIEENDTPLSKATIAFNGGAFNQPVDPLLTDADMPAYVGVSYIVVKDVRVDMQLMRMSFEVERFPNPLALPAAQNKQGDDINGMSAMYEVITSGWGGAGVDAGNLNTASLVTAAAQLATENNFASVLVDAEVPALSIIGNLQQQTYGFLYHNPTTGKLEYKLARQDTANIALSRKFSTRNATLTRFSKTAWADAFDVIRGIFVDRESDYEPTPVLVMGWSTGTGTNRTKRSTQIEYPYVTKAQLAVDCAARDLAVVSAPLISVQLTTDRSAAPLLPGDVVLFTWDDFNIWGWPMLVSKVRKSPINDNNVLLTLTQYILPDPSPVFEIPGPPVNPIIGISPVAPTAAAFITAPYWLAAKMRMVNPTMGGVLAVPIVLPTPGNAIQANFAAYMTNKPGATDKTEIIKQGQYPTVGQLSAPLDKFNGFEDGLVSSIEIDGVVNPANLRNVGLAGIREGGLLAFVGNEIISFESCQEIGFNQWRLNNVRRGLIDTAPVSHIAGTKIYIINNGFTQVGAAFGFPLGFAPNWRIISRTPNEELVYSKALAVNGWSPSNARSMLSPRPHDTRIDGQRASSPFTLIPENSYNVTWRTRSRTIADVRLQLDAADPSEQLTGGAYQYHRVYLRDSINAVHLLGSTPNTGSANSLIVTIPSAAAAGNASLFVRTVNQFGESIFDDILPVTVWKGSNLTLNYRLET